MYVLSPQEAELKAKLEEQVQTGFLVRGQALRTIERFQLYRDTFDTFESYCQATFGFTLVYIRRCMMANETYYFIKEYLETEGLDLVLPNKQKQLRPIFQAHLSPIEAGEVWIKAVGLAVGQVPSYSLVKSAVKAYLKEKYPTVNPFSSGEICRIISGVPGKKNCWCIVAQVQGDECVIDTWDNQYVVSAADIAPLILSPKESKQMLDLGRRMTALSEVGNLDQAAMWLLRGLEKLHRSQLNSLEERLLQVLEEEYLP